VAENHHRRIAAKPVRPWIFNCLAIGYSRAVLLREGKEMGTMPNQEQWIFTTLLAFSAAGALPGLAQEQQPNTGWRRVGDPVQQADEAPSVEAPAPHTLVVPAGTWITVRMNQHLSSDRNQQGDPFTATLAQPVVANGRVIARRGQTVGGIVADAQKAGHVKGSSRLGLQLTELSLADGRQVPISSKLTERNGNTSVGSDAAAIGATTGLGAAIGGAVDGGFGAGMGAIGGAVISTIGGRPGDRGLSRTAADIPSGSSDHGCR
jgi:hypothetical protein